MRSHIRPHTNTPMANARKYTDKVCGLVRADGKSLANICKCRAVKGLGDLRKHQQRNRQDQQAFGVHSRLRSSRKTGEQLKER